MRTYRTVDGRRGPMLPLPPSAVPPDAIYWSAMDNEADMIDSRRPMRSGSRRYIDPWDMENYAYIRRNMGSSPEPSGTQSPAGEPTSSTFYYIPGLPEECPGCYAGLDEQLFYNAKYESIRDEDIHYNSYTDIESSSTERPSSCDGSTVSTLQLHTPGFGAASGRRPLVLPKPTPQIEFPPPPLPPPSYDYYEVPFNDSENAYCSLSECLECENVPVYATQRRMSRSCHPFHFGLSKKGLLQIDYSCNWNNLDRMIAK